MPEYLDAPTGFLDWIKILGGVIEHMVKHRHWIGRDERGVLFCTLCNKSFAWDSRR